MRTLVISVLMFLNLNTYLYSSNNDVESDENDFAKHFITTDLLFGNARTLAIYYGYTVYNLNDDNNGTHLLTVNIGSGPFGPGGREDSSTPQYMLPVSSFLRYIVGGDVLCFEIEGGAFISSALKRESDVEVIELHGAKYSLVDFPIGTAFSIVAEPVYIRLGFGMYIRGRIEDGGGYLSFAIGAAL